MSFKRTIENFTCEHCGEHVKGDGYTNHCPKCLTSKHVDEEPGDRKAACGGLMRPVGRDLKDGKWRVVQRCERCGYTHVNKMRPGDNMEALVALGG